MARTRLSMRIEQRLNLLLAEISEPLTLNEIRKATNQRFAETHSASAVRNHLRSLVQSGRVDKVGKTKPYRYQVKGKQDEVVSQ